MKSLSQRNKQLLLSGASMTGSFVEGFDYIIEDLYVNQAKELQEFCKFIDEKVGGAGPINIDFIFDCFKSKDNMSADMKIKFQELVDRLAKYKR